MVDHIHTTILRVDLGKQSFKVEPIPEEVMKEYIGGKGLAAYYAYREIREGVEPLSPKNKLFVFNGPLDGIFPAFTRYVVASKSPASNTFCDSYAGGRFGGELAKTGYLGMIIEGRAEEKTILRIDGENVSMEGSGLIEGKDVYGACEALKPFSSMVIGEAGRRMVKYACIMNDMMGPGRAGVIGRGGLGAVMGSKNLDAIAIRGGHPNIGLVPPSPAEAAMGIYLKAIDHLKVRGVYHKAMEYLKQFVVKGIDLGGNLPAVEMCAGAKVLTVRNFTAGYTEGWEGLAVPEIRKYTIKKHTCPLCPLACGVHVKVGEAEVDRLEYETVALNGFNCGHTKLDDVVRLCKRCNELGLDTMSAGVVASFAMECTEKGIHDFGVNFGDIEGHLALLGHIARREGDGDLLAEGVKIASERLGCREIAVQIKGLEFPGYDPRGVVGMALAYATSDRGADHLRAWTITSELKEPFTISGKAHLTKYLQDRNAALWSLICCDNIPSNTTSDPEAWVDICLEMLGAVGLPMDKEEFLRLGERVYNLTRLFNVRQGISRKDDALPDRMHEGRPDTDWKISREDFDSLLSSYYEERGWSRDGVPTAETLKRLRLDWV